MLHFSRALWVQTPWGLHSEAGSNNNHELNTKRTYSSNSVQFCFIYITSNHNSRCLKVLTFCNVNILQKYRENPNNQTTPYQQAVGGSGKEKVPAEPASVRGGAICHDQLEMRWWRCDKRHTVDEVISVSFKDNGNKLTEKIIFKRTCSVNEINI